MPKSPYAWYRWSARVQLVSGTAQIWARAIDALGRSQPLDGGIHWNEHGYTWNGVEKIDVTVGVKSFPHSCSAIRSSWLYLASRSPRTIDPILI